ncbi:hypothetical protein C1646_766362 [Rhizophagus diaphanus]|nr:hypothetical protein C1646_766362 [Rhizophagus diaphanus] [Rhizophagus sp. MUCL 43196]
MNPFITTQGDLVTEANYMTNGIVFQIRGDLNNDEEKVKAKARRIRDLYGKIPNGETSIQLHSVDDLDSTEDILPQNIKDIRVGRWPLENSYENRESKTLR